MSLFRRLKSIVRKAAPIASMVPGPVGAIGRGITAIDSIASARKAARVPAIEAGGSHMSIAPIGREVARRVGGVARRFPGTVGTVGGIAGGAIGARIGADGRPIRRRAKGVSGRDIQGFKRVCKLASKFAAAKSRGIKCKTGRKRSC